MIGRRSLLLAGAALPVAAHAQCVTDMLTVDACLGGVRLTGPSMPPGATLSLNFMTPGTLDPRITFTRASAATYIDATGTMQTVAINAPRWDYDPVTHALRGLLLEDQRTNLAVPSIPAPPWGQTGFAYTQNAGTAPDGTNSLAKMGDTAVTGPHYSILLPLVTITSGQPYTFSVHAKAAENRYLMLIFDNNAAAGTNAMFDLQTGTVTQAAANNGGSTGSVASMVAIGNGIYRCVLNDKPRREYIRPCCFATPQHANWWTVWRQFIYRRRW